MLKDRQRIATRHDPPDRCGHVFLSAVLLATTVIFWGWGLTLGKGQPGP